MNILWESVKATAGIVGQAAVETGIKGKLQAELLLISNEIDGRKRLFGEELYEYVEPLSKTPDFYAANDRMTDTLRGPLLTAQREISALDIRRRIILDKINKSEQDEKGAYVNATNWQETIQNTAKKAGYVSHYGKLKTELGMVDVQIKDFKQVFGLELFQVLIDLEDKEGWLPTVRDIRSIYDQARRDIEKIHVRRKEKEAELAKLGGAPMVVIPPDNSASNGTQPDTDDSTDPKNHSSYFKQIAAVEAKQQQSVPNGVVTQPTVPMMESIGGPLSYSVPQMVPQSVTATTTTATQPSPIPFSNDPFSFVSTTTAQPAPIQQPFGYNTQPQAQQPPLSYTDPFAPSSAPSHSITHDPFNSSAPMGGSSNAMNNVNIFSTTSSNMQNQNNTYDPFTTASSSSSSSMPSMFHTQQQQQQQQSYDPFAILDQPQSSSTTPQFPYGSTTTNPPANDNPLFRY